MSSDSSAIPSGGESIQVYCRIRPSKRPSGFFSLGANDPGIIDFALPPDVDRDLVNTSKTTHKFKFNGLFDMFAGQDEIFDKVAKDAVESALEGYNSTVFAYGQTGSGKTFTITGGPERYQDRGLIPRSLQKIFAAAKDRSDTKFTIYISYLEIYNEAGYDLLDPSQETKALEELPRVTLMEDEDGNVHLKGLSMHMASNEEEALNLLFLGDTNRAIAETPMNQASSRSHCIFTISIESRQEGNSVVKRSKLHLVDLAGSERVHKTNAAGQLFKEATYINKSLHYLELVIVALYEQRRGNRSHIPYRNSIMTSVLRDSLGGNCKTSMIATINPELEHTNESISTCRFAQRVARVQNAATVNEETDPNILITQLKTKMSALEQEVAYLKTQNGENKEEDSPVTDGDISRINAAARAWVEGPDDLPFNLGTTATYERIKVAFDALRNIANEYRKNRSKSLVSQSITNSPSRSVNGSNTASEGVTVSSTPSVAMEDVEISNTLRNEIKRLKAHVQQRESEIALLVNTVKQLRAKLPPDQQQNLNSTVTNNTNTTMDTVTTNPVNNTSVSSSTPVAEIHPKGPDGITLDNGVFISSLDLSDRDRAFQIFRQLYPKHDAIEDNKILLKQKYDEAKAMAEKVNIARNETNRLKTEIERKRVEMAMVSITEGKQNDDSIQEIDNDSSSSSNQEEVKLRNELDFHKSSYKVSFQRLRDLKTEIEQIQRILEASRLKMQADFEAWYSNCLMKVNQKTHAETQKILETSMNKSTNTSLLNTSNSSITNNNNTTNISLVPSTTTTGMTSKPVNQTLTPQPSIPSMVPPSMTTAPGSNPGLPPGMMYIPPNGGPIPYPFPPGGFPPHPSHPHPMMIPPGSIPLPSSSVPNLPPTQIPMFPPQGTALPMGIIPGPGYPFPPQPHPNGPWPYPNNPIPRPMMNPTVPNNNNNNNGQFVTTGSAEADADIAAFYKAKEELLRRAKLASVGGTK